jgi:ADP-ribosylglycohydrolase
MPDQWMQLPALLQAELVQRREEGCDVMPFEDRLEALSKSATMAELGVMNQVIDWREQYGHWEEAWGAVNQAFGSYHWVHAINNTALVLLGLLYGEGDLGRSVSVAVMGGWDTDCSGATVGSIVGAMRGAKSLPEKWISPLDDRVRSCVIGYDNARISELARRTMAVAQQVREWFYDGS